MKIVYSDKKSGRTFQAEVPKEREGLLIGRKIGETLDGSVIGLDGYALQVTGLVDNTGAPSRSEIDGGRKMHVLIGGGVGIRHAKHGFRARRLVRGNAITLDTSQINTVITAYGAKPVEEIFPKKEKEQGQGAEGKAEKNE